MIQTGRVISSNNEQVLIQVVRSTACGHQCSGCNDSCKIGVLISTENSINAKRGDCVNLESDTGSILRIASLMYLLPISMVVIGIFFSKYYFPDDVSGISSDVVALVIAIVLLTTSMLMIHRISRSKSVDYSISFKNK